MGTPYTAYLTGHYRYNSGRTPTKYWDGFELWFATKATGAWVSTKVLDVATEYSQSAPNAKGGVAIANNGNEFLLYVYIYGPGFGYNNDLTRIMRSLDGGVTWVAVARTTWPSDIDPYGLPAYRLYYSAGSWILFSDNGVYISTDGSTWAFRPNGLGANTTDPDQCLMDDLGTLHMCCVKSYVIHYGRSTDLGGTWSDETPLSYIGSSAYYAGDRPSLTAHSGHVVIVDTLEDDYSVGQGVFANFSHDGGVSWEPDTARIEYLVPAAGMDMVRLNASGLGFALLAGVVSLCFTTYGIYSLGAGGDDYREWAYYCGDWIVDHSTGAAHAWTVATTGVGREATGSGVDPATGLSTFLESAPYDFFPLSGNVMPHDYFSEVDLTTFKGWTNLFEGYPEPWSGSAPNSGMPDLHVTLPNLGRYVTYSANSPVPNFLAATGDWNLYDCIFEAVP